MTRRDWLLFVLLALAVFASIGLLITDALVWSR